MLIFAGGSLLFLLAAWYLWFRRRNRQESLEIMHCIEHAFRRHGTIEEVYWAGASRFYLHMRLYPSEFHRVCVAVQMLPRESPLLWLLFALRHRREMLTFQADLDPAPNFTLEVHNHRCWGRTRRQFLRRGRWNFEHAGPYLLTTRDDWQGEIGNLMTALWSSRQCECSTVRFSRTSPHLSVTVPLEAVANGSQAQFHIFHVLRELALGASAAKF